MEESLDKVPPQDLWSSK